jgi:hypothetical protein
LAREKVLGGEPVFGRAVILHCVLREYIGLYVELLSGFEAAQVRGLIRVRDNGDLDHLSAYLGNGKADAVQRDGTLRDDLRPELVGQFDGEAPVGCVERWMQGHERDERCCRVDVTLHNVTAERRARGRWQLQVDDGSRRERAERGARERLRGEVGGEVFGIADVERRKADAVDRDAVARAPTACERGCVQRKARGREREDGSSGFNEAGEHSCQFTVHSSQ